MTELADLLQAFRRREVTDIDHLVEEVDMLDAAIALAFVQQIVAPETFLWGQRLSPLNGSPVATVWVVDVVEDLHFLLCHQT